MTKNQIIGPCSKLLLLVWMISAGTFLFAAAATAQTKAAISGNHPTVTSQGWLPAPDSKQISLSAVLFLRNTNQLAQLESDLQNRDSPKYHQWLTTDEFVTNYGPTREQMAAVSAWLTDSGFTIVAADVRSRRVQFIGTVATIREALETSIIIDGTSYVNTADPTVPAELAPTIQAILGLTNLPVLSNSEARKSSARIVSRTALLRSLVDEVVGKQGPNFAPSDLYTFYNESSVLDGGNHGTKDPDCVALSEIGDVTDDALELFDNQFKLPPVVLKKILVSGSNPGLPSDNEPALDVEWVHAVSPDTPIRFYLADASKTATPSLDAVQLAVDENVCGVISSSGEDTCPDVATLGVYDSVLQQAVVQGQTAFHSAGDYGANWICGNVVPPPGGPIYDQSKCADVPTSNTGSQPSIDEEAASPSQTSVGGTGFTAVYSAAGKDQSVITDDLEVAWNNGKSKEKFCPEKDSSGGGKSTVYLKPPWQTGLNVPDDGVRDVPDISLGADGSDPGFFVYSQTLGTTSPSLVATGGTSIASPMWAGVSRLIAASRGVTRLGNINPRLYELGNLQLSASGLHDVTSGNNDNSGIVGYSAGPGFDLVTGWGSPDIALLVAAFPGAALTAQKTTVTVRGGQSAIASTFSIVNTTSGSLDLSAITLEVTSPKLFSSIQLTAVSPAGTMSVSAASSTETALVFPTPLVIPSGKSAKMTVTVTASGGAASAIGSLIDWPETGGNDDRAGGLIVLLGVAAMLTAIGLRRSPTCVVAGLALGLAVAISSCGGGGNSGGSAASSMLSLSQNSVNIKDAQGGSIGTGGLPATLSNVTVR